MERFHAERPGITELAVTHAADPQVGTAYAWLLEPLGRRLGDVLDVACGNAALQPLVIDRCTTYLGVDLSEAELADARARGRGPVVRGDARTLPVGDEVADTVVSSMGLMLVHPLESAVTEIARVLRRGGTAAILVPSTLPVRVRDLPILIELYRAVGGLWSMPGRPSIRGVNTALESAGLRVVSTHRRRFGFPLREPSDAELARKSLYAPGRDPARLAAAERVLARRLSPRGELPLPLVRILAVRR